MVKDKYISFKEAHTEKNIQESALFTLETAFEDAMTNEDWCLVADLESELRSQIDRMSMIFQTTGAPY